jgi:hypothetical protein
MIRLPLVQKSVLEGGVVHSSALPVFYMNDYSRMGLWVSDCAAAIALLQDGFTLAAGPGTPEIVVDDSAAVSALVGNLRAAGIECGLSDVVDQLYQG